jgi:hypothetical protein
LECSLCHCLADAIDLALIEARQIGLRPVASLDQSSRLAHRYEVLIEKLQHVLYRLSLMG